MHSLLAPTTAPAFPAFLWRYENARGFDAQLTTRAPLMVPLNVRVMEWHMQVRVHVHPHTPLRHPSRGAPLRHRSCATNASGGDMICTMHACLHVRRCVRCR